MSQEELGAFGEDRPEAEAAAVAGEDGGPADVVDPERAGVPDADGYLALSLVQVDYTLVGSGGEERPVMHVFGRDADEQLEHVQVVGVDPYFYVPTADVDEAELAAEERVTGWEHGYESIRGEELTKVKGQTPRDVGQIRDRWDEHYEADVLFPNRFLIDNGLKGGVRVPERRRDDGVVVVPDDEVEPVDPAEVGADPRVHTLDIEVDDRFGFPEEGEEEIICLTSHDSYDDEYVVWLSVAPDLHDDATVPDELPDYEFVAGDGDAAVDVRSFASEAAMLDDYLGYVERTDPDVLTGWNFEDFDAPYLLDRLERVDDRTDRDLSIERLSRVDEVWRSDWGGPDVKGRVVFDLLRAYRRTKFSELESYRLDAVAETELGVGKERYPGDIGDLWEDDPEQLLEYNLRDVELCVELDRKQEVVAFWREVASFVGCKLEDAPTPGDAVDMYVLHNAAGKFALPSKGQQPAGEEFEGGAVFDPISGVRENVAVLDLKCFSGDTDLMTPDGLRNIRELREGDEVYSLDPDTFECEVTTVAETHEYENSFGELHHLSGNTHDLKITENHRFLVSNERGWDDHSPEDFEFVEYRDVPERDRFAFPQHRPMSGETPKTFDLVDHVDGGHVVVHTEDDLRSFRGAVPDELHDDLDLAHGSSAAMGLQQKAGKYLVPLDRFREHRETIEDHADQVLLKYGRQHRGTPLRFEMTDWLAFVAWYVTEGSLDRSNGRITLHQSDEDNRTAITDLLERMGVNYNLDARGINLSNEYLLQWLAENCGEGAASKRLPEWVFDLDGELLTELLDVLVAGDGTVTDSGLQKFWTTSDRLKTDVANVAVRCGEKPTVTRQNDGTWYVAIGKQGSFQKASGATVEDHDGEVYCVTTEGNHVVLAGRGGNLQWVGQSLYPMSMTTINASPETQVGEDYDGETYRAPTGTRFRKEPDGIIREMVDELLAERDAKKAARDEHDPDEEAYELYDRQQAAVKVIMNCFTPDTDVMTPDGVRNIRELDVGDEVYSLNPDTMQMEVKPVVETHEYPDYEGELVDMETSKIDFRVTPNHRMLVRKAEQNGVEWDDYRFVEAADLDDASNYQLPHDWEGPDGDRMERVDLIDLLDGEFEVWCDNDDHGHTLASEVGWYPDKIERKDIGTTGYVFSREEFEAHRAYLDDSCSRFLVHAERGRKWIPRFYDGDDFLELLAWYITEGSVYTSEDRQFGENFRGAATSVQIAQNAPTGDAVTDGGDHGGIGDLLDRMGFDYYVDERGYQFTSKLLGRFLERRCGEDSFEKRIPEFVFDASHGQKRAFLETLVDGDGDRQENSWRYSTASERLRDDVLRLCAHLGLTANYAEDSGTWRVYVTEESKNTLRIHRSSSRSTAEDGVYCVSVADNHTLLAGRNGTFQFVGQSLYGVSGWERFRLYDKDAASAVTATGREVIEFTDDVVGELGYQVVYGDSVTGDRPVVVRDPKGRIRVRPVEELFDRAETASSASVVVSADGGIETSVDTGKQRGTLDGWTALSLSEDGEPEWQPIRQVVRHETDAPVVNVQHKFGESTTTRDHSYVVEDDGEFVEAAPESVDEPVRIPGVPDVETVDAIDVYEVLSGYTRTYEDGRGGGRDDAVTKTKRVHADDEYVWFGHEGHGDLESTVKVQRRIDLDGKDGAALLRLLAAYVTEGSASTEETASRKFRASIAESHGEWLDRLRRDYLRLFENTAANVIPSDTEATRTVEYETGEGAAATTYDDETYKLQMMNELAAVFFREFAGQTSRGKRLPSFVFHLPERRQRQFLDTLVEGDGSREFPRYSEEYAERNFDFETTSRELAAGLSTLLTQLGEKHSLKYRDDKESYTIRTCDSYRQGDPPVTTEVDYDGYVYDLDVANNNNFVDGVGGVVLHNTDSVMLELGDGADLETAVDRAFELEERINDRYDEFAIERLNADEHRFQIEFEKLYRRFFQAGKKKRYAGHIVWKEGKEVDDIDITGFEYTRSDIAPVTKEVQHEVIQEVVTGADIEDVKEYLHGVIEAFRAGEYSYDEVAIPGGIGQRLDEYDTDTAHVRGAKYANRLLGTNFQRGSKPKRLYLEKVHPGFFERVEAEQGLDAREDPVYGEFKRDPDVICFEYPDQIPPEFAVDWDKMLDKTLKGPIARILEALDVSWEEVKSGQEQTGLGQYM